MSQVNDTVVEEKLNIKKSIDFKNINWINVCNTIIVLGILVYITIDRIEYVMGATANVPIMDYWRYIVQFVDKVFNEGVSLADLWIPQEGAAHRAMGMPIIFFLMNVKFFGLNTTIEVFWGSIATLINCLLLFWVYQKKMKWENNIMKYGFVLIALCMFNINQWEIITIEFSLGFATRIMLILLTLCIFDNLQEKQVHISKFILYLIFIFIVACLTGSYGPAVLGAMLFITLVQIIIEVDDKKRLLIQNAIILFVFALGVIFFFKDLGGGTGDSLGNNVENAIMSGNLIKAVLYMLGSSILHITSSQVSQNPDVLLTIGFVLFVLYILAICIFFKRKMYEKTYVPLMLMAYTACVILVISVGRIPMYGAYYLTSSRYVVETTLGLCGIVWVFLYELYCIFKFEIKKIKILSLIWISICSLGFVFIFSNLKTSYDTEIATGPNRKLYQENLINTMINNDTLTDEQAAYFQYSTWYVNEGIDIMQEYDLGVFGE